MAIQRLENGSYVLPEGDIRDKKYWNDSLKLNNTVGLSVKYIPF